MLKAALRLFEGHPVILGLAIRLLLVYSLPALLDDGLLLQGVRYTDIDYDVFTDAAVHAASGLSPYERHTYRYTPFLADLLALPIKYSSGTGPLLSTRYFGKIIFSLADVACGYIIVVLRRNSRSAAEAGDSLVSQGLVDSLWWLYNPLPINICTRGSAESLVVLLPVLATVFIANTTSRPVWLRACLAGIMHGIGIHAKLYPVIYTVSFMACFSRQQQQKEQTMSNMIWRYCLPQKGNDGDEVEPRCSKSKPTLSKISADSLVTCFESKEIKLRTFPWAKPKDLLMLAAYWFQRLFMTTSSV
ncbi:hypothetical protein THAOC_34585 [Thalassiosira oceanica]|uniref:GPI mannosyltransferase I n=1 Tax=Thalassiosira oceanica TaxID=159749 RepID=K0R4S2_THAOC|nr:hypothetical protein THAOC_34585 [Thalassiosira oceanica]|eukprot:EJK46734.1 hypothetical protein THAOC_34585 [Thalassiosira oceanica]